MSLFSLINKLYENGEEGDVPTSGAVKKRAALTKSFLLSGLPALYCI